MRLACIVLLALVCAAAADGVVDEKALFKLYKEAYSRQYATADEEAQRFGCFRETLKLIDERNKVESVHGINEMADLCEDEFIKYYASGITKSAVRPEDVINFDGEAAAADESSGSSSDALVPASVLDWRTKGAVSAVGNQGKCQASYAFALTGTFEGAAYMTGWGLMPMSTQMIVSCSNGYEQNKGCEGGNLIDSLMWTHINRLVPEDGYPYSSHNGVTGECKNDTGYSYPMENMYIQLNPNNTALASVVEGGGSAAVYVDVSNWRTYTGGVLSSCSNNTNAAALVVGWNSQVNPPYWILKNSWGSNWGEEGYIRLLMHNSTCGMLGGVYQAVVYSVM